MEDGADQLGELADRVQAGVFRVLVLGEFKRGKSTLINALLGANLLPANVTPHHGAPYPAQVREGSRDRLDSVPRRARSG